VEASVAGVVLFRIPKTREAVHYPEARAVVSHRESLCTPDCQSLEDALALAADVAAGRAA
jgi:hypothetical protein